MAHKSHKKIHKILREHHPEAVKKARRIFSFKYPKLLLLLILIIGAYLVFSMPFTSKFMKYFNNLGDLGVFISGVLTSIGFTTPFGIGLLAKISPANIWIAAIIGGLGATIADLFIFKSIKFSFADEFKKLEETKAIQKIEGIVKKHKHVLIRHYLLYIFAGILFITPLPDEIGVSMLAGLTTIKQGRFAAISFVLHTIMIFGIISVL